MSAISSPRPHVSDASRIEPDALCRICHEGNSSTSPLYHPCLCKGSIRYIHEKCLNKWLTHNKSLKCEVCGHSFIYKPIFVAGQTIPSSISYQSFIDIICWIYDELITKNGDLIVRLPIILFLWLIVCPFILFGINQIFYRYFILYDLLHFSTIYAPFQCLRCAIFSVKAFKLKTFALSSILCYFCPYHNTLWFQLQCHQNEITAYYLFVHVILKGISLIILILLIFSITIGMKNTTKIVRPPRIANRANIHMDDIQTHANNDEIEEEEKEEELIEEEIHHHVIRKRKETIYCDETDYKSPSLLISDDDDDIYSDEDDEASLASSTLSELEMKLDELQQRIKQKQEEKEAEINEEIDENREEEQNNNENNEQIDELDALLESIGLNDDIHNLCIKHIYWMIWFFTNHFSHFILPHFIGQISFHIIYCVLAILSTYYEMDEIVEHIVDLIDFNDYNDTEFIYTDYVRNIMVLIMGYTSCFVYQWILCTIMPCFVNDLQKFVRSSLFSVYLWLFDKNDILKGCFFLFLKFMLFPFLLTLIMESCFIPIREDTQWHHYKLLYDTFILQHNTQEADASAQTASSFMYVLLMVLWTLIAICTYLSTVDIFEKIMRPTAFTYLFRSVIETKNWLHPFSYQEKSSVQLRKWCMTTLHFVVIIYAFLGLPCFVMSQCNQLVPLNVPSVGKIKTFHVRSLLLQDYVLLFSVLPMLLFWEPIFRALVIQTLHISAYVLNLKFYLLRNYAVRDAHDMNMNALDEELWHNEQPFMDIVEDNHVPLPEIDADEEDEEEVALTEFIDEIVDFMIDNAVRYTIDSVAIEVNDTECKTDLVQTITECIEFITKYDDVNEEYYMSQYCLSVDELQNVEAVIDHISNNNPEYGEMFSLYRIKWKYCGLTQASWNHIEHLPQARVYIEGYKACAHNAQCVAPIILQILWNILQKHGDNVSDNEYGVIWVSDSGVFQVIEVEKFTQQFIARYNGFFESYESFEWHMVLWGFECYATSCMYFHPCFNRKSSKLLSSIGVNTVLMIDDYCEDERHAIIEIEEEELEEEEAANDNDDEHMAQGMDMMRLFDGIDLGGADNIIPAPIVMNVQLDNFGRLIKINVELDSYHNMNQEEKEKEEKEEHIAMNGNINNENVNVDVMDEMHDIPEEEEKKEAEKEKVHYEERVHIGELMRSLNSYQKSELLRDILSICHPLYLTEEKYCFIYDHNTKSDETHPLIRVLKKPAKLISIHDIVSYLDVLMLYLKILLVAAIVVLILNSFHLIVFLQCLVYGRKLWKILSLLPKYIIFELGFTNFTRFDQYGIMSFAFNQHTIHDLHCIALSLWWFPAMYAMMNIVYHSISKLFNKCSQTMDDFVDFLFSFSISSLSLSAIYQHMAHLCNKYIFASITYMIIFSIHHVMLPLLFGFCFFFALWSPVFIGCNQSFCCSLLEAWIEGFFVWNVFLPILPLSIVGDDEFKQRLKAYLETQFENMNLYTNCKQIYWPLLRLIIIHLFIPIALIRSPFFKYLLCESIFKESLIIQMKNYHSKMHMDEILFEFNKKWYLSYMMRKLLQCRLFIGYQRAIRSGCDKLWKQFINDKYVIGKKLVNYYYKKRKDDR